MDRFDDVKNKFFITSIIAFLATICLFKSTLAQAPEWEWGKQTGRSSNDIGKRMATGANGNIYISGEYSGSSPIFDSILSPGILQGEFLAKLNSSGNPIWVKNGLSQVGIPQKHGAVFTDAESNVYVTGNFSGTHVVGTDTLVSSGTYSVFVAKFNSDDSILWVRSFVGFYISGLAVDVNYNVHVTGVFFDSTVIFGNDTLTHEGGPHHDIFIAKYDSSGNELWATSLGGTDRESPGDIATDASGNVYISGSFSSPSILVGSDTFFNAGGHNTLGDFLFVKFDSNGNILWAKTSIDNANANDGGIGVAIDGSGNAYATGFFHDTVYILEGDTLHNLYPGNLFNSDIFIIKYYPDGTKAWVKNAGTTGVDYPFGSPLIDSEGNVYLLGNYSGHYFGDIAIVKYDSTGNELWTKLASSVYPSYYIPNAGTIDSNGKIFITGHFYDRDTGLIIANDTLSGDGIFVAKLGNAFPAVSATISVSNCAGSATANVTGGIPPFTYSWSNGQTGATATGLSPGVHSVTVSSSNGNSSTTSFTIGFPRNCPTTPVFIPGPLILPP